MAISEEDLVICMLAVIDQFGEDWNLEMKNIKKIYDMLDKDPQVRIGFNPMPNGESVIITGIVGAEAISEWERLEKMINTRKVGEA